MPLQFLSPLHRATRQISLHFEPKMARREVSNQEGHVLSFLRSYSPSPVGEVARVFGLRGSTLTGMLDRLEERGFITRELHPDDRRSFLLHMTPKGKRVANSVQEFVERFETDIRKRVSATDIKGFDRVMAAIAEVTAVEVRDPKEKT